MIERLLHKFGYIHLDRIPIPRTWQEQAEAAGYRIPKKKPTHWTDPYPTPPRSDLVMPEMSILSSMIVQDENRQYPFQRDDYNGKEDEEAIGNLYQDDAHEQMLNERENAITSAMMSEFISPSTAKKKAIKRTSPTRKRKKK